MYIFKLISNFTILSVLIHHSTMKWNFIFIAYNFYTHVQIGLKFYQYIRNNLDKSFKMLHVLFAYSIGLLNLFPTIQFSSHWSRSQLSETNFFTGNALEIWWTNKLIVIYSHSTVSVHSARYKLVTPGAESISISFQRNKARNIEKKIFLTAPVAHNQPYVRSLRSSFYRGIFIF